MSLGKGQPKDKSTSEEITGLQTQDAKDEAKLVQNKLTTELILVEDEEDEGELPNENGPHWLRYDQ